MMLPSRRVNSPGCVLQTLRRATLRVCAGAVLAVLVIVTGAASQSSSPTASPDGAALFASRCLLCHGPGGRAQQLSGLADLGSTAIYVALTSGIMADQAKGLSETERHALAEYVASTKTSAAVVPNAPCAQGMAARSLLGVWNGWSPDLANTRSQPAAHAGLSGDKLPMLRVKWAFAFPNVATAANQPAIVDGRMYIGSFSGTVYALDAATGCSYWAFKADSGVRTAPTVAEGAVIFGDFQANVYALDSLTGKLRWRAKVDDHPQARVTGSPVVYEHRVYVPVSSIEEGVAIDPTYSCCTFRGSLVALNVSDGKRIWKTYTIDEEPREVGVNKAGTRLMGPSGAAIWSTPTVDARRGAVYVTTGNNYDDPATRTADAVISIDLATGAKRWVRNLFPNDRWNAACMGADKTNCPEGAGPDLDFGAPAMLVRTKAGRDLLVAGQKSGMLYALDPDHDGALVWQLRVGTGGSLGGVLWGMAADGECAYVAVVDANVEKPAVANGSLNAVELSSGRLLWRTSNPASGCSGRQDPCSSGNAAPVTLIPGAILVGSLDGHLRAYAPQDGKMIWEHDTTPVVPTRNQATAHGGGISGAGPVVVNGMVYQTSGYAAYGLGMPGNLLLAFELPQSPAPKVLGGAKK